MIRKLGKNDTISPRRNIAHALNKCQKGEDEADHDIRTGKTTKTKNLKELFKELDK